METPEKRLKIKMFDEELVATIVTTNYDVFDKYKKIKLDFISKFGLVYYSETEDGLYLWLEIAGGTILICTSEYQNDMGMEAEIPAAYHGGKPALKQVIKHFEWKVKDENIWDD